MRNRGQPGSACREPGGGDRNRRHIRAQRDRHRSRLFPAVTSVQSFQTGRYRNLFQEYLGKTEAEIQAKLDAAWEKLFYGDDDFERVYYPVGDDMAYMLDVGNNDVRSEGMSYGMMIAVQLGKQDEFNRLWKWTEDATCTRSDGPVPGLFRLALRHGRETARGQSGLRRRGMVRHGAVLRLQTLGRRRRDFQLPRRSATRSSARCGPKPPKARHRHRHVRSADQAGGVRPERP